jgi:hypothetical protein
MAEETSTLDKGGRSAAAVSRLLLRPHLDNVGKDINIP